ncbi:MAG TPA: transposon-transfer assisting family protein [Clostridia bacterium]|nr:transposon-transfer assisting family protein [Clostridia bacterium]HPZ52692.1 transposon-transfer assisting family protein [Clostridia bacterium]
MFTVEEITLMKYCVGIEPNKEELIKNLKAQKENADNDIQDMIDEVINKLTVLTDEQFRKIDFDLALF